MFKKKKIKYRSQLIIFLVCAMTIPTISGLYTYFSSQRASHSTTDMFEKTIELTTIYQEMIKIDQELETYLYSNSSESLISFYNHIESIDTITNKLMINFTYSERNIKIKNVSNMISEYLKTADNAIVAKRGRNVAEYTENYEQSVKERVYILDYIEAMMNDDLVKNAEKYKVLNIEIKKNNVFNIAFTVSMLLFLTIVIILFSDEMTKPITEVALYAKRVGLGDFDVTIPIENPIWEIQVLYNVFNIMTINVKDYINQIQEKVNLENSLNEQRVNNLKMKNTLRETELLALQSQVNPHFIFNTINIGAKMAMLQGDDTTCSYLENAADIFRYNLRGLHLDTSLFDEVENVRSYMYLLTTRFGDFINYKEEIPDDVDLKSIKIPRMSLQPIVENAYIHGISELDRGGTITLSVEQAENSFNIIISDNGDGITKEKIDEIMKAGSENETTMNKILGNKGHTTGIGLKNVIKRLRLFFDKDDVIDIMYTGSETKFIIKIPREQESKYV